LEISGKEKRNKKTGNQMPVLLSTSGWQDYTFFPNIPYYQWFTTLSKIWFTV